MALINCAECDTQVIDKAPACPKCGAPIANLNQKKAESKVQETKVPYNAPVEKKGSSFSYIVIAGLVVLAAIGAIAILNNPNSIPGVSIKVNTPKPAVVTARADDANASLLNYKETVYATISNQGGDGQILVNFHFQQGGNTFTKTQTIYMRAGQNLDVKEIFDEAKRLGGDMRYSVDAQAR